MSFNGKVITNSLLIAGLVLLFSGCTAKEFEKGAKGVGDDISKLFDVRE